MADGGWTAHWLYWVAPVVGILVAAQLAEVLRGREATALSRVATGVEEPL